jgi:ATP/maltotriose-dependent transcriptional regulator MalT
VLDAVAVVPGRAESWLVEAMCEPRPGAVDACLAGGVLVSEDGTYAFRHELARLAVELDLPDERRRSMHQRAVAALADHPGTDPARIAHHAEAAGDEVALAHAAMEASLQAAGRTAYREAVRHGERALAVGHALTGDELATLQTSLAFGMIIAARSHEGVPLAKAAVEHWRRAGDDRREAAATTMLGHLLVNTGSTEAGIAMVERARAILERYPPGPELLTVYVRMTSFSMLARDRDAAALWGERAIALATELHDNSQLSRALVEYGIADVMDGRSEGLDRIRQGIDVARRHDIGAVVSLGLGQIGSGCGEMRRYDEAVPALIEAVAWNTEHNYESNRRYGLSWLARCRFDLGQWDDAEAHIRDALAGPRTVMIASMVGLTTLGWLRARRGDDDAWPPLDEAVALARRTGHLQRLWPVAVARAEAGWLQGDLEPHVGLLEDTIELARRCRHRIAVGELGIWLQRAGRGAAVPVDHAAEPFASWLMRDWAGAAAGFRRMGCPYEAASALADSGETTSLREALATFERLGARPMRERVAASLRERGVRVAARRPSTTGPSGLSEREIEVLRLVAAGFTNPQIASALFISRKTAEHHVSNILAKLGVTSRTEAAASAVRLGLAAG